MHGNPNWSCTKIVQLYLALKKFNVPVKLYYVNEIVNYLKEQDYVGIVPSDEIIAYQHSYFPNEDINDFCHFHEEVAVLKEAITWQPIEQLKLKE